MPGITQPYQAPALDIRPTETGIEAVSSAARRLGGFGSQEQASMQQIGARLGSAVTAAGEAYVNHVDHQEISAGAATGAQLFNNLTEGKDAAVKGIDPNDPHYGQKVEVALKQWREDQLEPALDKFRSGFNTEKSQQWAEHFIDSTRQHMYLSSQADIQTAAKIGITNSIRTFDNNSSNTAYNDPSSMPALLDAAQHAVGGMVGSSSLKGTEGARVQSEVLEKTSEKIVKAAAIGYINKTGTVPDWVSDPKYSRYVNAVELEQFRKAAELQQRQSRYYERQDVIAKKQEADLAVHKDATDILANGVQVDPNRPGHVIISPDFMQRAIDLARRNPDAPSAAATARTMIDWAESQQRQRAEPVVSDQTVKADLLSRIGAPDNPTSEMQVLDWAARDKLSARDTTLLREMVKSIGPEAMRDPLVHAALQGASERAGVGLMNDGHERYSNFLQAFWPEYLRQKNAGTLKPNWADFNDETSLIRQTMKTYEPTRDERLRAEVMKRLQGVGDTQTQPPAAPAAPAKALPPFSEREKNKVYPTARGPMKWTGTGWVNP